MMKVDQLQTLQNQIGTKPVWSDAVDRYEAMQSLKDPENLEETMAAMQLAKATDPEYSNKFEREPPMPLNEGGQPDLEEQAQNVAAEGRMGDSMLMHVSPSEVRGLSSLRPVTENPETGLPEAFVPIVAPIAASLGAFGAATAAAAPIAAAGIGAGITGATLGGIGAAGAGSLGSFGLGTVGAGQAGAGLGFFGNLWNAYKGLNPILQGGIKGALMSPISSMISGQEYGPEDLAIGTVLGLTLGGVEMGIDELAGVPSTTTPAAALAKPQVKSAAQEALAEKLALPTTTSGKIWAGAKKAASDPMFWGLSGLALAGAGAQEQQGRIEAVEDIQPFDVRPIPASRKFVGPTSEADIIAGVVAGEGEEDEGLGRQLQEVKEGGIVSLYGGGPSRTGSGGVYQPSYQGAEQPPPPGYTYVPGHPMLAPQLKKTSETGGVYMSGAGYGSAVSPTLVKGATMGEAGRVNIPDWERAGDTGAATAATSEPFEFPTVTPFQSSTSPSSFNLEERLARITGQAQVPQVPVVLPEQVAAPVPTDIPIPAATSALEDLFSRFQQKQGSDEIVDLVSSALPAQEGGPLSIRRPHVFEGQVPVIGDGMEDAVKFNVVPQTPADIPNTPDMALLSSDEYVVPADVVSMLGNGSSTAGAKALDQFNTLIRKKAHGTNQQQKELNAGRELSSLG